MNNEFMAPETVTIKPQGEMLRRVSDVIFCDTFGNVSPDDSDRWLDLMVAAYSMDPDLAAILQYLRNTGTRLVADKKFKWRLEPVIGDEAWNNADEYKREAMALKPYRVQMVLLLRRLE